MSVILFHDHHIAAKAIHHSTHHAILEYHRHRSDLAAEHTEGVLGVRGHIHLLKLVPAFALDHHADLCCQLLHILHLVYAEMLELAAFVGQEVVVVIGVDHSPGTCGVAFAFLEIAALLLQIVVKILEGDLSVFRNGRVDGIDIAEASAGGGQFLIIADDLADSFDYKNKYAIIEYLNDLGNTPGIDLLILTHNFDFYRTIKLRLGISRQNCLIAQRDEEGGVFITPFKYQKDFFKNVVIDGIKNGNISDDGKKKLLFSSIPFYRNLCEYSGKETEYLQLTSFLHLKTNPLNTLTVKLSDLWNIINPFLNCTPFAGTDEDYYSALIRIANSCVNDTTNEVLLENKLVIAIAIRLRAEKFLQRVILSNGQTCMDASSNQTREWFAQAAPFLTLDQKIIIEEVNLITPESIHLNSFMFEPLIDISDWALKDLYNRVTRL